MFGVYLGTSLTETRYCYDPNAFEDYQTVMLSYDTTKTEYDQHFNYFLPAETPPSSPITTYQVSACNIYVCFHIII